MSARVARLARLRGEARPAPSPTCPSERVASLRASAARGVHGLCRATSGAVVADGVVEISETVPETTTHGRVSLQEARNAVADLSWLCDGPVSADGVLYLDTETTGLSGGSGTLVFQIGLARWEPQGLHVKQTIMLSPGAERRFLDQLEPWFRAAEVIVTYNGKSFDVPLLQTRWRIARRQSLSLGHSHVDLLHTTRRAFGHRLQPCRLRDAEESLLGFRRIHDLDGAYAPQAWRRFVTLGEWELLAGVLKHNRDDVLSLAALAPLTAAAHLGGHTDCDGAALARYWLRLKRPERALRVLSASGADKLAITQLVRRATRAIDRQRKLALATSAVEKTDAKPGPCA